MTKYFEHNGDKIWMDDWWISLKGGTSLRKVPNFPKAEFVDLRGCTSLIEAPDFPKARSVYLEGCISLGEPLYRDPRGYELRPYHGGYVAGCRLFRSPEEAIAHWSNPKHKHPKIAAGYVRAIKQHMEEAA